MREWLVRISRRSRYPRSTAVKPSFRSALLALVSLAALGLGPADAQPALASSGAVEPAPTPAASAAATAASRPLVHDVVRVEAPSSPPRAEQWRSAERVGLSRASSAAERVCNATRVREWLRVRCATPTFAIGLLAGDVDGLAFWIGSESEGRYGEVQLALRPGDRRVVQLFAPPSKPDGGPSPSFVLQEHWLEGDLAPTVVVTGPS
jgi:hypothetical protein